MRYDDALSETLDLLRTIAADYSPAVLANAFGPESMVMTDLIAKHELDIDIFSIDTGRLPGGDPRARAQRPPALRAGDPDGQPRRGRGRRVDRASTARTASTTPSSTVTGAAASARSRRCAGPSPATARGSTGLRREQSARPGATSRSRRGTRATASRSSTRCWSGRPSRCGPTSTTTRCPTTSSTTAATPASAAPPAPARSAPGEDPRAGRWWWEMDTVKECGLHLDPATGRLRTGRHRRRPTALEPRLDDTEASGLAATRDARPRPGRTTKGRAMRVLILGGDGFCGWPTALHLSAQGHEVAIVDNLSRRKIDIELEVSSLTPIRPMGERLRAWKEVSGKDIAFHDIDVAVNYQRLLDLLEDWQPDALVHFAEQRAAPYSMKSSRHKRYTVNNNLNATNNVLAAVVESGLDIHVVHLGTMGVYGYGTAGMKIPEGYLEIKVPTGEGDLVDQEILYPANPGSIYHMTKTQDQLLFAYYNKNDHVRVTDLHQGIVWGTQTKETKLDERLINRFDYDGDYGTVLNRFLMQAAIGYPLTVHGTGGQTRAFIHIQDTVKCIQLALENPPERGDRVHDLQPDDRDPPGPRPGEDDLRPHRRRDRQPAEPAQRGRRERAARRQRPVPAPRPHPHHPQRGPDGGGHRDHQEVRRPLRPGRRSRASRCGAASRPRPRPRSRAIRCDPDPGDGPGRAIDRQLRESFPRNRMAVMSHLPDVRSPTTAWSTSRTRRRPARRCMLWLDRIHTGDHAFAAENVHRDHRLPTSATVGWERVLRHAGRRGVPVHVRA